MPLPADAPSTLGARSILMLLPVVDASEPSWLVHHHAMPTRFVPNRLSSRPAPASSVATVAGGLALESRCSLSRSQKDAAVEGSKSSLPSPEYRFSPCWRSQMIRSASLLP